MNVYSDIGKHVWIEIKSGGKHFQPESYRCVKCGETTVRPWNAPGPELKGCPAGDQLFDRSILHRQPASSHSPPRLSPNRYGGLAVVGQGLRPPVPSHLVCVASGGDLLPVQFHNQWPGFVLSTDDADKLRTLKILVEQGLKLSPVQQFAMKPLVSELAVDDLSTIAGYCTTKIYGVYWDLRHAERGIAYLFEAFDERGKA